MSLEWNSKMGGRSFISKDIHSQASRNPTDCLELFERDDGDHLSSVFWGHKCFTS